MKSVPLAGIVVVAAMAAVAHGATFRFEAESDFGHSIGTATTDGWQADPAQDPQGFMLLGPAATFIHRGNGEARVRAKISAPSGPNDRIFRLDVVDHDSGTSLASRDVRRQEMPGVDEYRTLLVPFGISGGRTVDVNVWFYDLVPVTVDWVDVTTGDRELSHYGINSHVPDLARIQLASAAQIRWLRMDFNWVDVQPDRNTYDWNVLDAAVDMALTNGQNVLATLAFTPDWATSGPTITGPPDDIGDWFNFVYWTVDHFRGRVRYWSIWNEPNLTRFWTGTRGDYINMVTIASQAIRQADPSSFVLGPELSDLGSSDWDNWLDEVLKYNRSDIDIVAHHVYDDSVSEIVRVLEGPRFPWETRSVRQIMADNGMADTPLWLTETGWTSTTHGEQGQSDNIVDLFGEMVTRRWWTKTFVYELADPPGTPTTWGILREDYSPKLAYGGTWDAALDGAIEAWVLAAPGPGPGNPPTITAFTWDGLPTLSLVAYGSTGYGARVAGGILLPGRRALVVTGPGPGAIYGPQVRAFQDDGAPLAPVNFYAYGTLRFGVNVAAADVDGDYIDEIVTGGGPGAVFGPHVRGWNYDGANLQPLSKMSYFAYGTLRYGVNVAAGKIDGDLFAEVLTGPGPSAAFGGQLRGWNFDAVGVSSMPGLNGFAYASGSYGCEVTTSDLTGDGRSEPVAAPGPAPALGPVTRTFTYDGNSLQSYFDIVPFSGSLYGGRVAGCEVDGGGAAELALTAGPDPSFGAAPVVLAAVPPGGPGFVPGFAPFIAYPSLAYGVNLGTLRLD